MPMNLNRTAITPVNGLYVYMPNVPEPHNCIVSENQTAPLQAGDIVTRDTAVSNPYCPVVKKAAVTDEIMGVVPYDSLKNSYNALDKISLAVEGSYIYLTAAGAIAQGAVLYFNADGQVTSTATAGNSTIGIANTSAAAAGDLIQVKLKFGTYASGGSEPDLTAYLQKTEAASTYVPQTRTINNKALSADITLTASDVGAQPAQA